MRPSTHPSPLRVLLAATACCVIVGAALLGSASAATLQGGSYGIDPNVMGASAGGNSSAGSVSATTTAGEAFVSTTSTAGTVARVGYVPQLPPTLTLSLDAGSVDLGMQLPGTSTTGQTVVSVTTDALAYQLLLSHDHDMLHTDAVTTIPSVAASIASPQPWTEGVTLGVGIGVLAGTAVDPKWRSGVDPTYAAITTTPQLVHAPSVPVGTDVTTIGYRVGIAPGQQGGSYSNQVVISAVAVP